MTCSVAAFRTVTTGGISAFSETKSEDASREKASPRASATPYACNGFSAASNRITSSPFPPWKAMANALPLEFAAASAMEPIPMAVGPTSKLPEASNSAISPLESFAATSTFA